MFYGFIFIMNENNNLLKIEIYKNWVIMYVDDLVVNEIISIEIKSYLFEMS